MKLGVAYYPEQWPAERWPVDAGMMRAAGLSTVRIADFAWALIEPQAGQYEWDWLDRAIAILADAGLQVLLCTPTAAPPPWLTRAHPEILPVDVQGRRRRAGSRRHYCPNSPVFHQHTRRIVTAMAERYGSHPAVVSWQVDNELGCHDTARCYCETCAAAFRTWLQARYGGLAALNDAWGNIFWSQVYTDWSEIDPPNLTVAEANPSHSLDYYRFCSDSYLAYLQLQIEALRPHMPAGQPLTTNYMAMYSDLNYYDLAGPIDFISMSNYPTGHAEARSSLYLPDSALPAYAHDLGDPYQTSLGHSLMRGFKDGSPFWVMEQQCGNVNWVSYNTGIRPGAVRLWTWHAMASGAEAVIYFRWRAGLFAQEQMHSGLLHHDASPGVGLVDLNGMLSERVLLDEISAAPLQKAQVALLLDYDSLWALRLQPHRRDLDPLRQLFVYYRALLRLGIPADMISTEADLSPYKLVIAPNAFLAGQPLADGLAAFAAAGGAVLLGVRSGFKTGSNIVTDQPLPGVFSKLAGATVSDWHALPPGVHYDLACSLPSLTGPAALWAEALQPLASASQPALGLEVLAHYTSGPFSGSAALVEHTVGLGRALYLGWQPNHEQAQALLAHLAEQAGIVSLAALPDGLIAARRGGHLILLNFTDHPQTARAAGNSVLVEPRGVKVVNI